MLIYARVRQNERRSGNIHRKSKSNYLAHDKYCNDAIPILWTQFTRVINYPIGYRQTPLLPPLYQQFIITLHARHLGLHFFRRHKFQILQNCLGIVHRDQRLGGGGNDNDRGPRGPLTPRVGGVIRGDGRGDGFDHSIGPFVVRLVGGLFPAVAPGGVVAPLGDAAEGHAGEGPGGLDVEPVGVVLAVKLFLIVTIVVGELTGLRLRGYDSGCTWKNRTIMIKDSGTLFFFDT